MRWRGLVLMSVSALAVACARRTTVPIDPAGLHREWTLVALRDSAGEAALVRDSKVTLQFMEDGGVGGRASINQFGGTVELLSDGTMRWSALTSTLMAGDPALMAQERRYLSALKATSRFELSQGRLTLSDSSGRVVLRFLPSTPG